MAHSSNNGRETRGRFWRDRPEADPRRPFATGLQDMNPTGWVGFLTQSACRLFHSFGKPAPGLPKKPLHALQSFGMVYADMLLGALLGKGWLTRRQVRSVCDFGSGTGGPALAILAFFGLPADRLTLLESQETQAARLRELFPKSRVVAGNGLLWLGSCRERYDLITAFMLGPDAGDGLTLEFVQRALPRLTRTGRLLICTDTATMHGLRCVLGQVSGISCQWLVDEPDLPLTVLVSKIDGNGPPDNLGNVNLPESNIRSAEIADAHGHLETEHYCLATPFEKAYLRATIDAFEAETPTHPGIAQMKRLLD